MKHTKGKWKVNQDLQKKVEKLNRINSDLLEACEHGAMSNHHPSCTHGKRGDGNTCECHVKKCQQAIAKATN